MSEYKGKRLDNGKWVYGDLLHLCDIAVIVPTDSTISFNGNLANGGFGGMVKNGKGWPTQVDPETVGQYKGKTISKCEECGVDVPGYEPQICCSGHECGCMGRPVEPCLCAKCWEELISDINRPDCPTCTGTGIGLGDPDTSKCSQCHGRGYLLVDDDSGRELQEDQRRDDYE